MKQIIKGYYVTTTGATKPISFIAKNEQAFKEKAEKELNERNIPFIEIKHLQTIQA